MTSSDRFTGILERLDQLNEFERQPVGEHQLQRGMYFAAAFAGEHVAATEFVIGALFVSLGASAYDILVGLFLGNVLAVLSWTLICAPIAVNTRLTLYWYLRQIIGPAGMVVYNVVNAVLYCALGGAMITVAASALRIPFGIPDQVKWYPEDVRFVFVVFAIGAVVVTLAILGFRRLAQFATVCAPWMIVMFLAGALATLPLLGDARSWSGFWQIANDRIWQAPAGKEQTIGFWHIVAFAWTCNLGMHLGLTDMALFRYAKRSAYGLYSSTGMFLGHYVSWICAGIMGAAASVLLVKPLVELDSGSVATAALGGIGALVVAIAGWTTANPMLYRSGLAFQVVSPGWPRWRVTLIAGVITTIFACSPFVFTKMLDFVVVYGLILMPMGTIVVVEHWLFPRWGWNRFWAARKGLLINWPAMIAWMGSVVAGLAASYLGWVHLFFVFMPVWVLAAVAYVILAGLYGARERLPDSVEPLGWNRPPTAEATPAAPALSGAGAERNVWGHVAGLIAIVSLAACLALPLWMFFTQRTDQRMSLFGVVAAVATFVYFVSGTIWLGENEKHRQGTS
ncbi:MAG: purine-cytosine permease family protein [Pirellulaceae bacterium]